MNAIHDSDEVSFFLQFQKISNLDAIEMTGNIDANRLVQIHLVSWLFSHSDFWVADSILNKASFSRRFIHLVDTWFRLKLSCLLFALLAPRNL